MNELILTCKHLIFYSALEEIFIMQNQQCIKDVLEIYNF